MSLNEYFTPDEVREIESDYNFLMMEQDEQEELESEEDDGE